MGFLKNQQIENEHRGYHLSINQYICIKHFQDKDIVDFIKKKGDINHSCFICENEDLEDDDVEIPKIDWNELLKGILKCIRRSFDHPANGLAYESSEGGYIGKSVYSTLELLGDVLVFKADIEVIEEIAECLLNDEWTESEYYGIRWDEELSYLWKEFSDLIKYKVRYIFNSLSFSKRIESISDKPLFILDQIGDSIIELNLIKEIPEKTNLFNQTITIYRGRQHEVKNEVCECKDIGSSPPSYAGANRFSAEGISMFYGAEDEDTAIKEIINELKPHEFLTIGQFTPIKSLQLIDLRNISPIGFFNFERVDLYEASQFLRNFVYSISQKINFDQKARIEYIPSQVVTEYFKHLLPQKIGTPIHGVIYKSTQNQNKDCYAIFADNEQCANETEVNSNTILKLKEDSILTYSVEQLLKRIK